MAGYVPTTDQGRWACWRPSASHRSTTSSRTSPRCTGPDTGRSRRPELELACRTCARSPSRTSTSDLALFPRRRRVPPLRPRRRRAPGHPGPLRVLHLLHPYQPEVSPGHASGHLRVADPGLRADRAWTWPTPAVYDAATGVGEAAAWPAPPPGAKVLVADTVNPALPRAAHLPSGPASRSAPSAPRGRRRLRRDEDERAVGREPPA